MSRFAVSTSILLTALVATVATGCGSGGERVVRKDGIVVRLPAGWFATNEPLNGISDPVQRLVVSSYRVPPKADSSGYYTPPAGGVLAQLDEAIATIGKASAWPTRPSRFKLGRLSGMEGFGGERWTELLFRQHFRYFYAFVWIGSRATRAQVAILMHALNGLHVAAPYSTTASFASFAPITF